MKDILINIAVYSTLGTGLVSIITIAIMSILQEMFTLHESRMLLYKIEHCIQSGLMIVLFCAAVLMAVAFIIR